jgi:hypothetical protein
MRKSDEDGDIIALIIITLAGILAVICLISSMILLWNFTTESDQPGKFKIYLDSDRVYVTDQVLITDECIVYKVDDSVRKSCGTFTITYPEEMGKYLMDSQDEDNAELPMDNNESLNI